MLVLDLSFQIFGMICCLFFKYNKTLQHGLIPYITFYLRCKCSTLWGARTHRNAMKRSMVNCLLYVRKTGYLLIVSSFKLFYAPLYLRYFDLSGGIRLVFLALLTSYFLIYVCPNLLNIFSRQFELIAIIPLKWKEFNLKNHTFKKKETLFSSQI